MKSAIVHDWIPVYGGAERVLSSIYECFPSPIYTLMCNSKVIKSTPLEDAAIRTSIIQRLPFVEKSYRFYLPLFPYLVEQFDLSSYDLIITSNHAVCKGVITNSKQLNICYVNNIMLYAWDLYSYYLRKSNPITSLPKKLLLHYIRMWDILSANRVDHFISNSKFMSAIIRKVYRRDSHVIYPPVDDTKFKVGSFKDDYYLIVTRLVLFKKVELIVQAFSELRNKKLIIIGDGPEMNNLKKVATKNVEFLGSQPQTIVLEFLQKAKAFIFASEEPFGIAMVESQLAGTPVIAYRGGAASEIVRENQTGILYNKQDTQSIINAIKSFEEKQHSFDPIYIRNDALRFGKSRFNEEFKEYILNLRDGK